MKLRGVTPDIQGSFVASSATVIGQVKIGAQSSVWYGAVLRGDDNTITIGENVTIGDRVMVHASKYPKPAPTVVGNKAVINSGAILHGCTVEDGAVIGEGAQVLDNARVGAQAVLAAGESSVHFFCSGNFMFIPSRNGFVSACRFHPCIE